jgi:hypothetical protein
MLLTSPKFLYCNLIPSLDAQALSRPEGSRYCDSKSHQERVLH